MSTVFAIWVCCCTLCFAFSFKRTGKCQRLGRQRTRAAQKGQLKRRHRSESPCRSAADSDSFESAMNLCEPCITQNSDSTDNDSSLHYESMCIDNNCSCTCEISFIDSDNVLPVATSCTHNDINNSNVLSTSTDIDCSEIVNDTCVSVHNSFKFLFMPVSVKHVKISACLDSGSTINIMSYELFSSLPKHSCTPIATCCTDNEIVVANGQKVYIVGTSFVKIIQVSIPFLFTYFEVPHIP